MANKGKQLGAGHGEPSPKSETMIYGVKKKKGAILKGKMQNTIS